MSKEIVISDNEMMRIAKIPQVMNESRMLASITKGMPPVMSQLITDLCASALNEFKNEAYPIWFHNIVRVLSEQFYPKKKLASKSANFKIGYGFGLVSALLKCLPKDEEDTIQIRKFVGIQKMIPIVSKLDKFLTEKYKKANLNVSSDYFSGYAVGLNAMRNGEFPGMSSAFLLQVFLLIYWRDVQKMKSVRELHAFLEGKFSSDQLGTDMGRLSKFCTRYGLKLKGVGRPKK